MLGDAHSLPVSCGEIVSRGQYIGGVFTVIGKLILSGGLILLVLTLLLVALLRALLGRMLGKLMPTDASSPGMRLMLAQFHEIMNRHLAGEFDELIRKAGVPTPVIDGLKRYFDPETPPLPDGSAEIPLDWRFLYVIVGIMLIGAIVVFGLRLL